MAGVARPRLGLPPHHHNATDADGHSAEAGYGNASLMAFDARWGGVMGMPRPVGPADDWVDLGLLQIDQATNRSWRSSSRAHYRLTPGGVLTV